ncbi:MAG: hypothetical protein K6G45_10835 [Lachnospiraceae bacterium]|nr:hypothetical protein [Lachnospiraceae bacterium]
MSIDTKKCYEKLAGEYPVLQTAEYSSIIPESFNNEAELYAAIIIRTVGRQLKTGLHREYISKQEDLTVMHGTMDIRGTVKNRLERKYLISCESDVLSENNAYNAMLKAAMMYLLRRSEVNDELRKELKKQVMAFSEVDVIEPGQIDWKRLTGRRSGAALVMLAQVCRRALEPERQL